MENPMTLVYALGIGIVVLLLIAISLLCKILDAVKGSGAENAVSQAPAPTAAVAPSTQNIPNRKKIIAAVSAAIAEDMGCDVSAIRIKTFRKI